MQGRDGLLMLLVPILWGLNFPATALMLQHYPPLLGAALRFLLLAVPTVLLVPRPQVRLIWLIGTGLGLGVIEGLTKVFWPEASNTVVFIIMVIVLLLRPAGLFGKEK